MSNNSPDFMNPSGTINVQRAAGNFDVSWFPTVPVDHTTFSWFGEDFTENQEKHTPPATEAKESKGNSEKESENTIVMK